MKHKYLSMPGGGVVCKHCRVQRHVTFSRNHPYSWIKDNVEYDLEPPCSQSKEQRIKSLKELNITI